MTTKSQRTDARLARVFPWLPGPGAAESPDAANAELPDAGNAGVSGLNASSVAPVPRVCLSRSDAARALGIGLSTLKALERDGNAPPAFDAPGGRKLYPVASLIQWAEDRARGTLSALHDRRRDAVDGSLTPEDSDA